MIPCPQTWSFSSFSDLSEPHNHPSGLQDTNGEDSLKTAALLTSHFLVISQIYAFFSVFLTITLVWASITSYLKGDNTQLIHLLTFSILCHSPHCGLNDLFKMQSILSTLCLKLGGFSLPAKAKPNSLDWSTKPWLSCPCCPPSMPHTPHTLYLLCVHLTDHLALLTQQVLSHFSAYNSFLHIYWFLHTPQGFWHFHGKNLPNLPPLSLPRQCTRWQIIIQPPDQ